MPLLLDAFSCAGLGADGYARAGWDVVCLDKDTSALRHNPHPFVIGDATKLLADKKFVRQFDAVHTSTPCQGESATRCMADAQGKGRGRAEDLLRPVYELLVRADVPFVMENVERSKLKGWPGVVRLCGSSWGLKVQRHRLFAPGPGIALEGSRCDHGVFELDPVTGKPRPWGVYYSIGDSVPNGGRTARSVEHGHEVMGIKHRTVPWRFLCEGLPTQYTEHIGRQLLEQV